VDPDESLAFGQDVEAGAVVPDGGLGPHVLLGVAHGGQIRRWRQPTAGPLGMEEAGDFLGQAGVIRAIGGGEDAVRGCGRISDDVWVADVNDALGPGATELGDGGQLPCHPGHPYPVAGTVIGQRVLDAEGFDDPVAHGGERDDAAVRIPVRDDEVGLGEYPGEGSDVRGDLRGLEHQKAVGRHRALPQQDLDDTAVVLVGRRGVFFEEKSAPPRHTEGGRLSEHREGVDEAPGALFRFGGIDPVHAFERRTPNLLDRRLHCRNPRVVSV
jgi:hypothetical protein